MGKISRWANLSIWLTAAWLYGSLSPAQAAVYSYSPEQMEALKAKLHNRLSPGDIVYLEDGTYTDCQFSFIGKGTADKPITLRARNVGSVVLTGKLSLKISGEYLIVSGFILKDGEAASNDIIEFRSSSTSFARHCRLTNCVIDNCNNPDEKYRTGTAHSERWVMLYGTDNQVDHCYFVNKTNGGVVMMINLSAEESRENHHRIESNFFGYHEKFSPGNNAETLRIGDSGTSQYSSKTLVSKNFFYQCNGETEIISIKSGDNRVEGNTFYESQGGIVCRHGHRNTLHSNLFIGNRVGNCAGIRVINEGHRIYNNFFQEINGTKSRSALCIMSGVFETPTASTDTEKEPLNAYHRVKDVDIYDNTFVLCAASDWGTATSYTYDSNNPYYPGKKVAGTLQPQNCRLYDNLLYHPEVNTMLNKTGDTSGILCSDNLYRFKKAESTPGFTANDILFEKILTGKGRGLYKRVDKEENRWPEAAIPSECGTPWYPAQADEMELIEAKTDFSGLSSSSIRLLSSPCPISIRQESKDWLSLQSSIPIQEIEVYSLQGSLLHKQGLDNTTGSIYFPYAAGLYGIKAISVQSNRTGEVFQTYIVKFLKTP